MKRIKISAFFLLLLFLFCGCSCRNNNYDKFVNYKCFDYHLCVLDAENAKSESVTCKFSEHGQTRRLYFRRLKNADDEDFVCARCYKPIILGESVKGVWCVMQNPENYTDVWNRWTVKELQLYAVRDSFDLQSGENTTDSSETANTPDNIIYATTDTAVISEFVSFVNRVSDDDEQYGAKYYRDETYYSQSDSDNLYIRLLFNESDVIIWESKVLSKRARENGGDRFLVVDCGKETKNGDPLLKKEKMRAINGLDTLYPLLSGALDEYLIERKTVSADGN